MQAIFGWLGLRRRSREARVLAQVTREIPDPSSKFRQAALLVRQYKQRNGNFQINCVLRRAAWGRVLHRSDPANYAIWRGYDGGAVAA